MVVHGRLKNSVARWESAWRDLMTMLVDIPERSRCQVPPGGGWSVQQVLQHLYVAESSTLSYLRRKAEDPSALPRVNLASRLRVMALELALASPLRFKAPAMASEAHFPAEETWEQTLQRIRTNHQELHSFLRELDSRLERIQLFRHPVAGRMPIDGVFRFFRWHVRHHQRQVWRILGRLEN